MKLAALGAITVAIGIWWDIPGLIGIGALWVLLGPVVRRHGKRLIAAQEGSPDHEPPADGRTFAYGTLLWALLGVPSLLVGILRLGIDADHTGWRWLPLVVGVLALGFGGLALALYVVGRAGVAVADRVGVPEVPATLWIRSVKETGTFINERPRLEFVFGVEPDAGTGIAPYEVTKKASVPFTAMAGITVGDGFKALVVGPEDPTSMEIRWDERVRGTV
ncbi:MAG: hypothetical protein JWQ74_2749 [Marmoricola sp.]|nr:hypothetical protein [Marmoricola sp.]